MTKPKEESGIYGIFNTENGKVYVGQTNVMEHRLAGHLSRLKGNIHPNRHLQGSWNKHGESSFEFRIIELCNEDVLNNREIAWIEYYDSTKRKFGYNFTYGGGSGGKLTPEHRAKIAKAMIGRRLSAVSRKKLSESKMGSIPWNKGRKMSPDEVAHLSKSLIGHKVTDETRKRQSEAAKNRIKKYGRRGLDQTGNTGPSSPRWGKKHSPETKTKMKAAWKRKRDAKRQEREAVVKISTRKI